MGDKRCLLIGSATVNHIVLINFTLKSVKSFKTEPKKEASYLLGYQLTRPCPRSFQAQPLPVVYPARPQSLVAAVPCLSFSMHDSRLVNCFARVLSYSIAFLLLSTAPVTRLNEWIQCFILIHLYSYLYSTYRFLGTK